MHEVFIQPSEKSTGIAKQISPQKIVYVFDKQYKRKINTNKEKTAIMGDLKYLRKFRQSNIIRIYNGNDYFQASKSKFLDIILMQLAAKNKLNHIFCKWMKSNNISFALPFSIFTEKTYFSTIIQNLFLCRKYRIPIIISPFLGPPYGLRAQKDIDSLINTLTSKNILM
ncbi:hypothetical protein GF323_02355 [Candidatus Woesearchaeota archaeon]|nr:hypothetical protein [Candidatus Woesearchaeota archaeon]